MPLRAWEKQDLRISAFWLSVAAAAARSAEVSMRFESLLWSGAAEKTKTDVSRVFLSPLYRAPALLREAADSVVVFPSFSGVLPFVLDQWCWKTNQ